MRRALKVALATCALAALGCGDKSLTAGLDQPIGVQGAQFIEGELPGTPPDQALTPPRATSVTTELTFLRPRLPNVAFFGWATLDAVAIAARIEGQGDGYWVVPTGPPDPAVQGDPVRVWRFLADLHDSLPPGRHRMLVAALDDAGRAGNQVASALCVQRPIPDNGNVCDSTKAPPELVVSLAWDRPVDLDLIVVTPSGELVASRSPAKGLGADQKVNRNTLDKNPPNVGFLDFDSNSGCRIDGRQLENIVFQERPQPGSYLIYMNLHDTCGEHATRYAVSRHVRAATDQAGTYSVAEAERTLGSAVAIQANGSTRLGTFVSEFFVP